MDLKRRRHLGSSFDDFLADEGLLADVTAVAEKRVLAWQVAEAMRKRRAIKAQMARRLRIDLVDAKK